MFAAMITNISFSDVCRERLYNNQGIFTSNNLSVSFIFGWGHLF